MKYQREILKDVEGYTPGEQLNRANIIKLNTNENPYPPSPKVMEALAALTVDNMRKYPDPLSVELRRVCAERYGYDSENWVIAGNGMDEVLAMTLRTFVDPGDTVISVDPTYSLYEVLVQLHGAAYRTIDLNDDGTKICTGLCKSVKSSDLILSTMLSSSKQSPWSAKYLSCHFAARLSNMVACSRDVDQQHA